MEKYVNSLFRYVLFSMALSTSHIALAGSMKADKTPLKSDDRARSSSMRFEEVQSTPVKKKGSNRTMSNGTESDPYDLLRELAVCPDITSTTTMVVNGKWLEIESVNTGRDVEIQVNPWDDSSIVLGIDIGEKYVYKSIEEAKSIVKGISIVSVTEAVGMGWFDRISSQKSQVNIKFWSLWKNGQTISKKINIEEAMVNLKRWEYRERYTRKFPWDPFMPAVIKQGWEEPLREAKEPPETGKPRIISVIGFVVDKGCPSTFVVLDSVGMEIVFPNLN